jgi:ATP-binding cassette subfamily B protein
VFRQLDLTIEAGRSLAIVGDNGAGKTTLVKLLARLYDPSAGRITVDGIDLRQIDPRQWHRRVAAIFQDFVQFELTARDNVAFGAPAPARRRPGGRAGGRAGGRGGHRRRPGPGLEHPARPAVQQRGRAVGRAVAAAGAGPRAVRGARRGRAAGAGRADGVAGRARRGPGVRPFLELTRGITTIVISHRFSTVRRADRIVVLEHGQVVEDGSHDQLVALGRPLRHHVPAAGRRASRRRPTRRQAG